MDISYIWDTYLEMEHEYEKQFISECIRLGADENIYFYSREIESYMVRYDDPSEAAKDFMESGSAHKIFVPEIDAIPILDNLPF